MASKTYTEISKDGLWTNNPALVQLLGLCPLLAVTGSVVNALGLGVATILVMLGSNIAVSLIRNYVSEAIRLPAFVMIIASFTTCAELLMQAYAFDLYQQIALFMALIVTNCAILGRADAFARKNPLLPAAMDGLMMGLGFTIVLVILGALREMIGQGTLFAGMELLIPGTESWKLVFFDDYANFLFAILPPGAFVGLALIIAFKNYIDLRLAEKKRREQGDIQKTDKRVRVTGKIA